MTTLRDRPETGLLVVDMQLAVLAQGYRREDVIANVRQLVEKARREHIPVVWVRHHDDNIERGSAGWQILAELGPRQREPVIGKSWSDAFEDTSLETLLRDLRIGRLFVVGAETDACIRSTLHGALVRGYDTILVSDAHTTSDNSAWGSPPPEQVIAHTNLYWTWQTAPGRTAGTRKTHQVDFGAAPAEPA